MGPAAMGPAAMGPGRRLLSSLRPERRRCAAVAALLATSALAEMAIPYYTGRVTDWISGEDDPAAFTRAIRAMVLLALGSAITEFVCDLLYNSTVNRVHWRLQSDVFAAVLRQELGFFQANRAGDISSRVTRDTDTMSEALSEKLSLLLWYLARGACLYGAMACVSPRLALVTTLALPVIVALPKASGKFHQSLARRVQESLAWANEVALETFQAMATVRSFANEDGAARCYRRRLHDTYQLHKQEAAAYAASLWTSSLSGLALRVGILYHGGQLVTEGHISTGDLVTFVLYEMQFTEAVEVLLSYYPSVKKAVGSSEKIFEYLEREPQMALSGTLAPSSLRGHLQLRDVWFSYPGRDEPVLKGVSLELHPGEVLALVGPSGSGKSTLVSLLQRLGEPAHGRLLLDGHDLHDYELRYLRAQVAAVRQEPKLFARSLHDNIAYGPGHWSRDEVEKAARRANAHDFITRLHHGYDTDAGEMGGQISGGQRQAVAIARALVRDPRVLVLDDPTSALDNKSELQVQRELAAGGRTVLLVTARAALVAATDWVDRVAVLEGGCVGEQGPPDELLRRRGRFWSLLQAGAAGDPPGNQVRAMAPESLAMWVPPALRLAGALFLADMALLAALAQLGPKLAQLGLAAAWLEAGLRFPALAMAGRLLAPGGPRVTAALLCLAPAAFLALRACLALPGAPPALLATASPGWLVLAYGASGLALLTWRALGHGAPADAGTPEGKATLRRLLALTWPEWPYLCGAFIFLTLAVIGETLVPYYTGRVIDILSNSFNADSFTTAIWLMCLASVGSSLFAGCRGGFFIFIISRLNFRTCDQLFSHLVRQELAFFQQVKTADLTSRLATDVPVMNRVVPMNANVFLRNLVKALGLYGFMVGLSWRLTLLTLLELPLAIAARKLYDVRHQALLQAILEARARAEVVVQEAVSSIETVQGFGAEEEEACRYERALDETRRLKDRRDLEQALFVLFQRMLQVAMQALMLYCGRQQIHEGVLTTGSLVSFLLYQGNISHHVQALVYMYGDLQSNVGAACKVFEYLDREPAVGTAGTQAPTTLRGHVAFRNVSFAYPARPKELVLQDVSFELRPGEVTALVGLNGSGKSTCVGLLERFYEPQAGEVLLDGVPLREYDHKYLHRQVALVGQEPVLFSGSIRDNIAYGLEGCGEQDVRAAARAVGALDFISALDNGFDTDVGEKGGQLSAGQKQRVAIARALIRRPSVLILDEATSALDGDSELALQQSVLRGGARTVLLIAHRPRMVESADRIVVLERGAVAETGTHAELLARGGPYSRLVQRERHE
ncbi:antigen peptide transporter 2 [Apteryx mantelli]|uniref:Antigen peptide transporter 2 n=1 Tax=Apteryx mantelli TaxID=2696672 RepID=A0ABM4FXT4_9AVES